MSSLIEIKLRDFVAEVFNNPLLDVTCIKKADLIAVADRLGITERTVKHVFLKSSNRVGHGRYNIQTEIAIFSPSNTNLDLEPTPVPTPIDETGSSGSSGSDLCPAQHEVAPPISQKAPPIQACKALVPTKDPLFIPWGNYSDIKKVLASGEFCPIYVSGHAGNGKSAQIKQICAELKKKFIRVQLTNETAEDDLIGHYVLINHETVWQDGPVIVAMKEGATLCLDECDRASSGILNIQGVLEGEPILVKKTGEMVYPAPGFQVIATGNTKGRADDSGRYTFANIIDEAFLERFVIDIEQPFPKEKELNKILRRFVDQQKDRFAKLDDAYSFVDELVKWGITVQESFDNGASEDTLSIRRLVHTLKCYMIFKQNAKKAVHMTTNRFDNINREAFRDLFTKISKLDLDGEGESAISDGEEVVQPDPQVDSNI